MHPACVLERQFPQKRNLFRHAKISMKNLNVLFWTINHILYKQPHRPRYGLSKNCLSCHNRLLNVVSVNILSSLKAKSGHWLTFCVNTLFWEGIFEILAKTGNRVYNLIQDNIK